MSAEIEYTTLSGISGPLIFVEGVSGVGYGEIVEIRDDSREIRIGQTLEVDEDRAVVQVFEGTSGLSVKGMRVTFVGKSLEIPVDRDMLGRVFDGLGRPIDGAPQVITQSMMNVNGLPINPWSREYPRDFFQTGISAIEPQNTIRFGLISALAPGS